MCTGGAGLGSQMGKGSCQVRGCTPEGGVPETRVKARCHGCQEFYPRRRTGAASMQELEKG